MKQQIQVSYGALDSPGEWASLMTQAAPAFDAQGFQKKIDKIVGTTILGEPIIRLSWARDVTRLVNCEWDSFGNATESEWQQTYCAYRWSLESGDTTEISPPRWVLEQRFEPEQYEDSWEGSRYLTVPLDAPPPMCKYCFSFNWVDPHRSEGVLNHCRFCHEIIMVPFVRRDVVGPAPRDGWYGLLYVISRRGKLLDEKFGPWGGYRTPDQSDLTRIKRAHFLRNKDPECNPREKMSDAAMELARRHAMQAIDEMRKPINQEKL